MGDSGGAVNRERRKYILFEPENSSDQAFRLYMPGNDNCCAICPKWHDRKACAVAFYLQQSLHQLSHLLLQLLGCHVLYSPFLIRRCKHLFRCTALGAYAPA